MPLTTESTTFTRDVLGRYVCNTFQEAQATDFRRFDIIVVGGGSFGAAIAEQLFQLDSPAHRRRHRVLVLEGGPFVLPEHVQNLPPMHATLGGPKATTIEDLRNEWRSRFGQEPPALMDRNLIEPGVEVWGLAWHSRVGAGATDPKDKRFPGLAYCVGGRSLFWGGWSPELIDSELTNWPPNVVVELKSTYFAEAKRQIGTDESNDFIAGDLHDALRTRLFAGLGAVTDAIVPPAADGLEAPLAVQSTPPRPGFFPFNKFSAVPLLMYAARHAENESPGFDFGKRLMIVPNCHVIQLQLDQNKRINRIRTSFGDVPVLPNAIVILGLGTVESTRLALLSFPNTNGLIGKNLMAHLRSNTTIRVPRAAFPALPNELQASALFVKGKKGNGHFHLQITACGVKGDIRDSEKELNKKIPDIDTLDAFMHVTDDFIVFTLRGIGEMEPNKTVAAHSRVDLDPEPDEHGVNRAIVTLGLTQADRDLWNTMDAATEKVAQVFAGGPGLEYLNEQTGQWQTARWTRRDGLGTTHHEGGTLWMDVDPTRSVTDTIGRFHEVGNALAVGPALFPVVGSPNPMLGGMALLRRTARILIPRDIKPTVEAGFTSLFDDTNLNGWQMAGPGRFVLENRTDDKGQSYGVLRSEGGMGLLWHTPKKFKNFVLRLDWRMARPDDNSGVFVRFPDPGNDPWVAVNQGYEVQIDDFGQPDRSLIHSTGAIYGFAAPSKLASRLVGEWNDFEIRVEDQQYVVALNGETVTQFVGSRETEGFIGVQNYSAGSQVLFRNIRIKEIIGP
jgi:choline dehydrogenase-like flavoprotein